MNSDNLTNKELFMMDYANERHKHTQYMIIVIALPTGSKEVIVNSMNLGSKYEYYLSAYDNDLRLNTDRNVRICKWMFV